MRGGRQDHARYAVAQLINAADEPLQQGVAAQQGAHTADIAVRPRPCAQAQGVSGGKHPRVGEQTLSVACGGAPQPEEPHPHDGDHQVHHGGAFGGAHNQPPGEGGEGNGRE